MYTQCPECLTIYRIAAEALAGGRGSFRCGHCESVFDALPSLVDKLPLEVTGELPRQPAPMAPPLLQVPAMHPRRLEGEAPKGAVAEPRLFDAGDGKEVGQAEPGGAREPGLSADWLKSLDQALKSPPPKAAFSARDLPKAGAPRTPVPAPAGSKPGDPKPSFSAGPRGRPVQRSGYHADPPSPGWRWGCAVLLLTLAGQVAWAERAQWLRQPPVRRVVDQVLGWFGQHLPPLAEPALLSLTSRDVRPHTSVPGALLITASMRNAHPELPVAFPRVEIRMTDLTGKAVAMRRFEPAEYLGDPSAIPKGIEPGAMVPLVFEVVDPGRSALNFEFAFRMP
jgi:predicted Zn finger-like uncharacterized protein